MPPLPVDDLLMLLAAIVLAAGGGEAFVRGIVGGAARLRIPQAIAATTLAAFATSSPELTVSTVAALSGEPQIGLGDALGSNVVNIALIFALALLFGPLRASRAEFGSDFLLALGVPLLTLGLLANGLLTRAEGLLLLLLFGIWCLISVRRALHARRLAAPANGEALPAESMPPALLLALLVGGLVALILAGRFFVQGASGLAAAFAIDSYIIGALVVAVGTSLPELATVLLARWRGHDDIGVGTLIGSNLFNGLCIVGLAATLQPIAVPVNEVAPALLCGLLAVFLLRPRADGWIGRGRALPLLGLYAAFIFLTLAG